MSNIIWVTCFGHLQLEAIFRGNDLQTASVEFTLKNSIGHIV